MFESTSEQPDLVYKTSVRKLNNKLQYFNHKLIFDMFALVYYRMLVL